MIKVSSLNPDPIYLVVSRCLKSQYQRKLDSKLSEGYRR